MKGVLICKITAKSSGIAMVIFRTIQYFAITKAGALKKLLLILLFLPLVSNAEKNLCRKVSRTSERKKGIVTYKSPRLKHITALRQFKKDECFGLLLYMEFHHEMINEKGASVKFDDGTVYQEQDAGIKCQQQMTMVDNRYTSGNSNPYMLQCFIHITPDNYEQFTTKRITAVYMGDASAIITKQDGTKLTEYIKCLADKNP
jgi:hypothetical protein